MDEFDLIRQYFAPLSQKCAGSLGLTDDAAILPCRLGSDLIITKDAVSEGIHFIGNEPAATIAQKALRVNLSDLAAMGAEPVAYFLALMLPKTSQPQWIADFAKGLATDQDLFSIYLAGGDTITTLGPLSLSITAVGYVPSGQALCRSHAQPGDIIYVSGTLGDSALGLQLLQHKLQHSLSAAEQQFLTERYMLPQPRLSIGRRLVGIAHAAMDISDGLVQDLGHICNTSNVGATIEKNRLPLSAAAAKLVQQSPELWQSVLNGGDDYELLFTIPAERQSAIESLAKELNMPLTSIGTIHKDGGVSVLDDTGVAIPIPGAGFKHFS